MSALRVWVLKNDETRDLRSVVTERDEDYDAEFLAHHAGSYTEHVALPVAEFEAMRRELEAGRELFSASKARATVWTRETYEALIDALRNYADATKGGGW